jgi:hypothetical protein
MTKATDLVATAIQQAIQGLDPHTAAAMRSLYIITEPGNKEADALIETALQENGIVSATVVNALTQYNLVNSDGTIPVNIKLAIQRAVKDKYLITAVRQFRWRHRSTH